MNQFTAMQQIKAADNAKHNTCMTNAAGGAWRSFWDLSAPQPPLVLFLHEEMCNMHFK